MMIVLQILLWVFIVIVFMGIILLILPIYYRFSGGFRESYFLNLESKFAGVIKLNLVHQEKASKGTISLGPVPINFSLDEKNNSDKPLRKKKAKEKKVKDINNKTKAKNGSPLELMKTLIDKGFLKEGGQMLGDIIKILRPDSLKIKGAIGFDEPHYTGWLLAFSSIVNSSKILEMDINPVWDEEYLELEVSVQGRIIIGLIILRTIRFFFTKSTFRVLKKLYKYKKSCNNMRAKRV